MSKSKKVIISILKHKHIYHFTAVFLIGFILRFFFLLSIKSIWGGEADILDTSSLSYIKLFSGKYWDFSVHPFFIHLLVKFWSRFSIDERWLRFPSLAASAFSIFFIYLLAIEIFQKRNIGLIASTLFAFSSYNIRQSAEMRFYSLELLFEIISLYIFIKIINWTESNKLNKRYYFLFVIFSFLALITDYSFFWLFITYVFFISWIFIKSKDAKDHIKKRVSSIIISLFLILILFSPWFLKFIRSSPIALSSRTYILVPKIYDLVLTLLHFLISFPFRYGLSAPESAWWERITSYLAFGNSNIARLIYYSLSAFLLICLLKIIFSKSKIFERKITLFKFIIILPLVISFFISQKYPIFIHYNLMVVQIGIIFLLTKYIYDHNRIGIIILIVYIFLNLLSYNVLLRYETSIEDWRKINLYTNSMNLTSDSAVVIFPYFVRVPFDYYNKRNKINYTYDIIEIDPNGDFLSYWSTLFGKYSRLCYIYDITRPDAMRENISSYFNSYFSLISKRRFMNYMHIDCYKSRITF